jgi:hypothetical protein
MIQTKDLFPIMQPFMFNKINMMKGYTLKSTFVEKQQSTVPVLPEVPVPVPVPVLPIKEVQTHKPFTPFQKDKLFWCFFILLKGYEEYEMNHSNSFSLEKKIKIETVEKLKGIKERLKELKLKRTELEDNLVNDTTISIKGLYALCLVHNISITYVYGRKYCLINPIVAGGDTEKNINGIIIQNAKKEDSLHWNDQSDEFLSNVTANYWLIENIQKPLNAPSAYTLKELQDISQKLQIDLEIQVNEKTKLKTKTKLYEEILSHI